VETEGLEAVTDYSDRGGYDKDFLGADLRVPLPKVVRDADKVLRFGEDEETELRYHHFSVVMHEPRRMCIYSAVNIDGRLSKSKKRTGWRLDSRIPNEAQILKECYGDPPKFSRGHMTRREDPVWGTDKMASGGNADSMHVTNAVPQMQPFNAPIWLGLEDYALENAREDDQRISVFTGPVFRKDDPTYYGVKVPVTFWKIIAFIHDVTGRLCATGYTMSQKAQLPQEGLEFVFGQHEQSQTSLKHIEKLTGLKFGAKLVAADPFDAEDDGTESTVAAVRALSDPAQIRWV
jgi:endonuclease G